MRRIATSVPGERIDRCRTIEFEFDGRVYSGFHGDTLASALLAQGVRVFARSFKLHRPRGILGIGDEEPNAIVRVLAPRPQPLALATTLELEIGLRVSSLNCWPGPRFDLGAINDLFFRLLPVGFYYKTFMGPKDAWPFYERWIRRAAGLGVVAQVEGKLPEYSKQRPSTKQFAHCDVLIAGAGPAGTAAALVAGRSGASVILADDQTQAGGSLTFSQAIVEGGRWLDEAIKQLDAMPNVRRLPATQVSGFYEQGFLTAVQRASEPMQTLWKIRARQVILATGAIERPMLFVDNDRPGVMLASAALAFAQRYAVACGRKVLVVCNNNSAWRVAFELVALGIGIAAIVDVRKQIDAVLLKRAATLGLVVLPAHSVTAVNGRKGVRSARVEPLSGLASSGAAGSSRGIVLDCDLIAMSGGWNPRIHLHSQSGGKVVYDPQSASFLPGASLQASRCAGSAMGMSGLPDCYASGRAAGLAALNALGRTPASGPVPEFAPEPSEDLIQAWWNPPLRRGQRAFVDFANDVSTADLALAQREGYESVELVKRYTTTGMGIDQGKTSNVNAIGVLAHIRGVPLEAVGTTSFRAPYAPVEFGTVAGFDPGQLIRPARQTPMTNWHITNGAVMYESGAYWRRPGYYPRTAESMADAVRRECLAVRQNLGFYDSSPLGKIEVSGPAAAGFLEWVYAGSVADLKPGRGRYGLMLREDGRLFDDGVAFRLDANRFWVSTTAGNADGVYAWLEYLRQRVWRGGTVFVVPVTAQWANAVVCGPRARELLGAVGTDLDLSRKGSPFMSVRDGIVAGLAARVFRVSFTGELSFEINVAARHGLKLWEALDAAGSEFGMQPVGSEANHVLRIEKGYISIGHEADGLVSPDDLGLAWAVQYNKPDFIGKRSLLRVTRPEQAPRQLVGLITGDPQLVLAEGAQLPAKLGTPAVGQRLLDSRVSSAGYVTASAMSPTLGRSIALALLENGRRRIGETIDVTVEAGKGLSTVSAVVAEPVFFDPEGTRLHA